MFRGTLGAVVAVVVGLGLTGAGEAVSPGRAAAVAACSSLNFTLKTELMRGFGKIDGYSRNSGCGYECGRKTFRWDNGPQGFGDGVKPGTSTQWPCTLNMASTFDPSLASLWGTAMGEEFWGKGTNIQEGPGINVARIMRNGRNFEYVSGEDPILGSRMVVPIVQGIQQNVMAISKHYIANNQETDRSGVNEVVDEVTLMELYSVPFAAAAPYSAGYMCSYNRLNGDWACENKEGLRTLLKGYFNFTGFVVSDWGACHSTGPSLANGLDIEMPEGRYFTEENIQDAINKKEATMADVDDSCVRILSGWYSLPEDKRHPCGGGICIDNNVSTAAHKTLARELAAKSTVLLKNDNKLLPLSAAALAGKTIALIGSDAMTPYTHGGGSGSVVTNAVVSPLTALQGMGLNVTYTDGKSVSDAVAAAKAAELAIVFGSAEAHEGADRTDLNLGGIMDQVIPAVGAAQPRTIVVLSVPGSILTDWRASVPVILTNGLPGEQVGPALTDTLFGAVPPQAKLPVTFPTKENEQGMTTAQWPGVQTKDYLQANYTEGQIVGYRWYDKHKVTPAFPFGHGLSYATFTYSGLSVSGRTVSFSVQRDGAAGCDTPQVYLGPPNAADPTVPVKRLKYFEKVCGASATVTYTVSDRDVSNWDVVSKQWRITPGTYTVYVGTSSQDILLTGSLTV